jgi:hypothetical protein
MFGLPSLLVALAGELPLDWLDFTTLLVSIVAVAAFGMYMCWYFA